MFRINDELMIDEVEVEYEFSRSSGPGGQNVNKVETRVTLCFDVAGSPALDEHQRKLILSRLHRRISRQGILRIDCSSHRRREANRKECRERFVQLLAEALKEEKPRKKTRVSRRQKQERLQYKIRRGRVKKLRKPPAEDSSF